MMNWMQNGTNFTIGPFQELNFETLKIVRKYLFHLILSIQIK